MCVVIATYFSSFKYILSEVRRYIVAMMMGVIPNDGSHSICHSLILLFAFLLLPLLQSNLAIVEIISFFLLLHFVDSLQSASL